MCAIIEVSVGAKMTTTLLVSLGKEKPMEEFFTIAFQTVLRNRHNEPRFIVETYDSDGMWMTRVYQCDSNGKHDGIIDCVDKEVIYYCFETEKHVDVIFKSHMDYVAKYSPLTVA